MIDATLINESLLKIDNWMPVFYALAPMIIMFYKKEVTSFVLVVITVWASEALMREVREPLMEYAWNPDHNVDLRRIAWYGTWLLIDICIVLALKVGHIRMNISSGRLVRNISLIYCCLGLIQILGYLDSYYWKSDLVDFIYRQGVTVINIGIGIYLIFEMILELKRGNLKSGTSNI